MGNPDKLDKYFNVKPDPIGPVNQELKNMGKVGQKIVEITRDVDKTVSDAFFHDKGLKTAIKNTTPPKSK